MSAAHLASSSPEPAQPRLPAAALPVPAPPTAPPVAGGRVGSAALPAAAVPNRARRLRRRVLLLALLLLLGADLARAPARQLSARLLLAGIHLYQATLSPRMPALGVRCRFTPTCSHYAEGAITRDGALRGTARALWRIARCGPWTPLGTYDPP